MREGEPPAVDLERRPAGEAALAEEDVDAEPREALGAVVRRDPGAQPPHPLHHRGEVDVDAGHADAEGRRLARRRGHARGRDHRLRRHAADVQAVAAEEVTLDEGHACPEPRGARGRDEARRPAADDHEVVARGRGRVGPAGRVHVRDEHAVVLVVGLDQRRRYRRRRFRVRFIPRRVRERAAGDACDVERDGDGRDETPEVERLLQGSPRPTARRQLGEARDE